MSDSCSDGVPGTLQQPVLTAQLILAALTPQVQILVLPEGTMPEPRTDFAVGYDATIRALVSPTEMDPDNPMLRKTLFDFRKRPPVVDSNLAGAVMEDHDDDGIPELVYRLDPGKSVLAGIGFATAMPPGLFYWVAPRSGLASKYQIQVTNAPGTVDPDYRGEAGALICNNGAEPFLVRPKMRIVQILFQWAIFPHFQAVQSFAELSPSTRLAGGFGSTGLR